MDYLLTQVPSRTEVTRKPRNIGENEESLGPIVADGIHTVLRKVNVKWNLLDPLEGDRLEEFFDKQNGRTFSWRMPLENASSAWKCPSYELSIEHGSVSFSAEMEEQPLSPAASAADGVVRDAYERIARIGIFDYEKASVFARDGVDFRFGKNYYRRGNQFSSTDPSVATLLCLRAGVATIPMENGTVLEFASNQPRITPRGIYAEESRTNLWPYSRGHNSATLVAGGSIPPTVNKNHMVGNRACFSVTFPATTTGGYAESRAIGPAGILTAGAGNVYTYSGYFSTNRVLQAGESIQVYATGQWGMGGFTLDSTNVSNQGFRRFESFSDLSPFSGTGSVYLCPYSVKLNSPITLYFTDIQIELGSSASSPIPTSGAVATRPDEQLRFPNLNIGPGKTVLVSIDYQRKNALQYFTDTQSGVMRLLQRSSTSGWISTYVQNTSVSEYGHGASLPLGPTVQRYATTYRSTSYIDARNGQLGIERIFPVPDITGANVNLGGGSTTKLNGWITDFVVIPFPLTDEQTRILSND